MGEVNKKFKWKMLILSFSSIILGCGLIGVCYWDLIRASNIHSDFVKIESFATNETMKRINNILIKISKVDNFNNTKINALEMISTKLGEIRPLWIASCVTGIICGALQVGLSIWLFGILLTQSPYKKRHSETWLKFHIFLMIVLFAIFGLIYISGFYPDVLVIGMFVDFLLLNFFIWVVVPILSFRKKEEMKRDGMSDPLDGLFIQQPYAI